MNAQPMRYEPSTLVTLADPPDPYAWWHDDEHKPTFDDEAVLAELRRSLYVGTIVAFVAAFLVSVILMAAARAGP